MNSYSYEFTKYNTLPCGLASSRAPIRGSTVVCFLSCLLCEVLLQTLAIEFGAVLVCVHRTVAGRVPGPLVPALQEQKSQQNMSSGEKNSKRIPPPPDPSELQGPKGSHLLPN